MGADGASRRPVTEVRGMRIFIKRSNGSEDARPVGETGRVSLQPAAWASGPHHRWRVFWNALGRTQTRSRKEHQIGIGGRGEEVPGPLGTIALLRRRLKCSAAIAERSSSRRFSRYWKVGFEQVLIAIDITQMGTQTGTALVHRHRFRTG